jgi:mono/diheme cytochrome c family protein
MRIFRSFAVLTGLLLASAAGAQGGADLKGQCGSCHALEKPANPTVDRLWQRKGPDLWYAGDKFQRPWLVQWLQKPTVIRPGGVFWHDHVKPGEPRDTLDTAAVPKHMAVDAATAEKLADQLLALKSGLVPSDAFKASGPPGMMAKLAFGKLRGCSSCHQDAPGRGGLSAPELYDAGRRLQPNYVYAYTKDPQMFDRYIWMPRFELSELDLQRLTAYIASLGKEAQ